MSEEANTPDVNEQEVVAPAEATEGQPPETPQEPSEGSKEYNWRRMEQKVGELERQNALLARHIVPPQPQEAPVPPDPQFEEDDLATVAQVDKRAQRIVEAELAKREKALQPTQTKSKYTDYDAVVTPENIKKLTEEDPDLEHDISVAKNPYARAYKAIKQSKFYSEQMTAKDSEQQMASNSEKPLSSNTIGKQRPLSHAQAYSKGSTDLWAEMTKYRSGSI